MDYLDFFVYWKKNFYGWNVGNFGWGGDIMWNIFWCIMNGEFDGVNFKVIVLFVGMNDIGKDFKLGVVV